MMIANDDVDDGDDDDDDDRAGKNYFWGKVFRFLKFFKTFQAVKGFLGFKCTKKGGYKIPTQEEHSI